MTKDLESKLIGKSFKVGNFNFKITGITQTTKENIIHCDVIFKRKKGKK